ncbi:MAG TPA: hypothetical protein VFB73_17130 [Chloroflexota bacterium]|nr:hypothetical protein [Chloroflexota bacterium]
MRLTSRQARFETLRFDGRDLTDDAVYRNDVSAYQLRPCRYCGTVRDERFPFCCGLDADAHCIPDRMPITNHRSPSPDRSPL